LVDIGASGGSPKIWQPIRAHSIYVGFDGDDRDIRHPQQHEFRKAHFVHEVITPNGDHEVTFYLTRSPYCCSTLRPNTLITENFLSADSFIVEREQQVKASNLNSVLDRLGLDRIDWLKIDTQGTDLRIYNSLRQELRDRLLAIDVEPGLRGAYLGEDLFCDVHKQLAADGFWLSNLRVCGLVRMRKSTLDELAKRDPTLDADAVARSVRQTPGWTECRYFRSLESLAQVSGERRDYLLLWVFALIDKQHGFCVDLTLEYGRRFGGDEASRLMEAESIARINQARLAADAAAEKTKKGVEVTLFTRVKRKVKRVLAGGPPMV
ncbi:MAG: hypothetical protein ABIP55_16375, partial [Tepidisphaeraceae bacterium]